MRTILAALIISVMGTTIYAAENTYEFSVMGDGGESLGSGKIRLPFKLGADGKGTADWQFTPTRTGTTNKYWMLAKARLAAGKGKATAECKESWFTLDFNPGWADNNVTVSWALDKHEAGTLCFADFSGGHPCASFRISKPARPGAAPSGARASPPVGLALHARSFFGPAGRKKIAHPFKGGYEVAWPPSPARDGRKSVGFSYGPGGPGPDVRQSFSTVPGGTGRAFTLRYPPLKRWAIFALSPALTRAGGSV